MDNQENYRKERKSNKRENSVNASIQRHPIKRAGAAGLKIFSSFGFSMPAGNVMETLEKLIKSPEAAFPCIFINWAESSAV